MMNLISFETPPLGRSQDGGGSSITAATTTINKAKEAASHLDLSLGISLSHGGDAGTKASSCCYGGGGGGGGDGGGCMGSGMLTAGVLGVGHGGSSHDNTTASGGGGGSWTAAFMPSPTGFMHPWSLAARQQKAAAEQERSGVARLPPATTYMPRAAATVISLPAAVGWPPVHTSRRNLVATINNVLKPDTTAAVKPDRPTQATAMFAADETTAAAAAATEASRTLNMFAKVHMDGYKVGRKINLRAHRNYDSLCRVLTKMTHNFFCPADYSSTNKGEEDCAKSDEFIFLYEDFEGDRMLVGDVPWELFLASAKRLYIAKNPAPRNKEHAEIAKRKETEDAIDN
ncbi:auxin-responsive protein IAA27 [Oryza glaberrima]|uniref:Auxin-responsive protein n=1 Tax=Oryza glaberrima TaxID=4538 RepID=I1QYP8_ORYGL|nr:auxin-responsive protein IAA27 [Oryza glaberrima]